MKKRNFQEATGFAHNAIYFYPWSPESWQQSAVACREAGEYDKALGYIIAAIILSPGDSKSWHSLAVILNRLSQADEANLASAIEEIMIGHENRRRLSKESEQLKAKLRSKYSNN